MPISPQFTAEYREELADRCASFNRSQNDEPLARLKHAAVAILVVDDGQGAASFVLTRRTPTLRSHGGQWALPGGRCDAGESAAQAVLREIDEEIGLRLAPDHVLGLLDDYPTRSGYLITPVIVWAGSPAEFVLNPAEVAAAYRVGFDQILADQAVDFVTIPQSPRQVVRIRLLDHLIHAPTAAVLYQFREMLAGRETRVAELEQPVFAWR